MSNDPMAGMVDQSGIAEMFGLTPSTVRKYRSQGRLPPEDATVLGRPVWRRSTIMAWHARRPGYRGERPGRKRSAVVA
jgi:hypothetical protein